MEENHHWGLAGCQTRSRLREALCQRNKEAENDRGLPISLFPWACVHMHHTCTSHLYTQHKFKKNENVSYQVFFLKYIPSHSPEEPAYQLLTFSYIPVPGSRSHHLLILRKLFVYNLLWSFPYGRSRLQNLD